MEDDTRFFHCLRTFHTSYFLSSTDVERISWVFSFSKWWRSHPNTLDFLSQRTIHSHHKRRIFPKLWVDQIHICPARTIERFWSTRTFPQELRLQEIFFICQFRLYQPLHPKSVIFWPQRTYNRAQWYTL